MRAAPAVTTDRGLLLVDKSAGRTSHDVVLQTRRAIGVKRVGHTGTLDPFATGLVLLLVGAFTRLAEHFHVLPKTYEASLRLGVETDSDDLTGSCVRETRGWESVTTEAILLRFSERVGPALQTPSTFSAKRISGKRAYDLARMGEPVELAPVPVVIQALEVTGIDLPSVHFRATVSTGTFVRALARDIGRDLGLGAHLTRLRRTEIGPFRVRDALLDDDMRAPAVNKGHSWRLGAEVLPWLPRRLLRAEERAAVSQGRSIERDPLEAPEWSDPAAEAGIRSMVALIEDGDLVAVAEAMDGRLQPRKVFTA